MSKSLFTPQTRLKQAQDIADQKSEVVTKNLVVGTIEDGPGEKISTSAKGEDLLDLLVEDGEQGHARVPIIFFTCGEQAIISFILTDFLPPNWG